MTKAPAPDLEVFSDETDLLPDGPSVEVEPLEELLKDKIEPASRTEPVDIGPDAGGDYVLAGWDGLYWVFGARKERFDITPEGVYVIGLTMDIGSDVGQIASDMKLYGPTRIGLLPAYLWAKGDIPDQLDDPKAVQRWAITFFRGAGEEDSTKLPEYMKKKVAEYKKLYSVGAPRGRKRKIVKLDIEALDNLDDEVLDGVDMSKLEVLKRTIESAMARQAINS